MTAAIFFVIFFLLCYLAGTWGDLYRIRQGDNPSVSGRIATGGCIVILSGCIISFAGSLFGLSVNTVAFATAVVVFAVIAGAAVYSLKKKVSFASFNRPKLHITDSLWLVALGLIAFSIIKAMSARSLVTEAVRGIDVATFVFESGYVTPSDPMMLFMGVISRILCVHPLDLAYNLSPPTLIVFYNICALYLVGSLFDEKGSRLLAFTTVCLMNIWGYQSDLLAPVTLLLKWFGGGVFIMHGIAPTLAAILIVRTQRYTDTKPSSEEYPAEEWDMNHKIINSKNLAIAFAALVLILAAVVFVLNNKINRLYDATVNLQNDINSRCSVYEFTPSEGDVAAYLLKGSDGSVTVIGGGSEENASALGEFIASYGNRVDKWYVYADDDENAGAMNELISAGKVNPDRIFVIDRKEITGIR